ncbi:MAG: glycosyltransferase family 8 protein [Leucobacter sp.]
MKASLHSLLESHRGSEITVHIIGQQLSDQTITDIDRMVRSFEQEVEFIEMPDFSAMLGKQIDPKQYTLSAFSRLFVDSLIDPSIERIIYLDCDTVVKADLSKLWDFELDEAVIGAVNDCRNWRYLRHLGLPKTATYINSGVLLIDLVKFRSGNWQQKFRAGILRYDGLLEFPDNDLICMLMQNDLAILPPEYNMISPVRMCSYSQVNQLRRPSNYYSREAYDHAKRNPAILHYTTFFGVHGRPWHEGYEEVDGSEFCRHIAATGGTLRPPVDVSSLRRLAIRSINGSLRPTALRSIGIVHSVLKPNLSRSTRRRIRTIQAEDAE